VNKTLLIWGAGGHGKVAADTALAMGSYSRIAFVDDDPKMYGASVLGFDVIGGMDAIPAGAEVFIAVGDNLHRAQVAARLEALGVRLATLRHPSATISSFASVGEGTLIMPRAVINAGAILGGNCVLNSGAIVEHDCVIDNFVHLSPAACTGGNVHIGEAAHLGIGAIVLPGVSVGARAVVGAGCVVHRNLPENVVAVGVPARIIRRIHHADPSIESKHYRAGEKRGPRGSFDAASLARPQASRV
jgi:sugar O-acyltransferase (sialic acid O-acetyltransferase NeuD family)